MDRTFAVSVVLPQNFFHSRVVALIGAIAIGALASPAMAQSEPSTRLIRCGTESCLLVTGDRADPASVVSINGQTVSVEGRRGWRVRIPVETLRQWSAPDARTIDISLRDPETQRETTDSVDLPVGLLGHLTDLSALEVSIN